jgi:hypothetical protein
MTFGFGKIWDKGLDEDGAFSLTNEWRRSCRDRFSARNFHRPEEKFGKFNYDPLKNAPIIQELDDRNEEDNGRKDSDKEPS